MKLLLCVAALAPAGACDRRPDQWDAFVYPDRFDLTRHEAILGFKSFESCQVAAIDRMHRIQGEGGGDYECGYKCAPRAPGGLNVCKETRK